MTLKKLFHALSLVAALGFGLGPTLAAASNCHADAKAADAGHAGHQTAENPKAGGCSCGADCKCGSDKAGCKCGPDCKCAKASEGCKCGADCKCEHCGGCKCKGEATKECKCGPDCKCGHCQGCKCGHKG